MMEKNLFRYILRHSRTDQLKILFTVVLAMGFYFLSLNLPKAIVNEAIQGKDFPTPDSVVTVAALDLAWPDVLGGGSTHLFDGLTLARIPYLFLLSFAFLVLVVVNNGFKFHINTTKGRLGERMLRRLRYELYDCILRFPLPHFRKVRAAEMATMIKDEVEPLGGFIGDAFVTPAMLGGQAITAMVFIMGQSLTLGSVALAIVLLQAFLVPRLRRPVLRLGRQRQLTARELAGRIAETVDGAREIRVAGTADYERAGISDRLGRIFEIRFELYQRKFAAKLVNNFLAQLTPFIFYAVGGYFAIRGSIDIGALVAVIAAYKDLPGPLKELIDWDQQRQDVQIKYEQVVDQFQVGCLAALPAPGPDDITSLLGGEIVVSNLGYADDSGIRVLDGVSFAAVVGERIAVVGSEIGGKHELAMILAGLLKPASGSMTVAGLDLSKLSAEAISRHWAYVGPECYLFPRSIYDNIVYGLLRATARAACASETAAKRRRWRQEEARRTGNFAGDAEADWIDYDAAGVRDRDELEARLGAVLGTVMLDQDVYALGLRSVVDPGQFSALVAGTLAARAAVAERLREPENQGLVERFSVDAYNQHATVAENLLFGVPVGSAFGLEELAENRYMRAVLDKVALGGELLAMGLSAAATMVELFADLSPENEFLQRYSVVRQDELPTYKAIVARAAGAGVEALDDGERARLVAIAFRLLPGHRLADLDAAFQAKVVHARHVFRQGLPEAMRGEIDFFDIATYTAAAPVLDNILFGRIDQSRATATLRVPAIVNEIVDALGLRAAIMRAGLAFNVGSGGGRLSSSQRQKIALGRALLKRPELLIVDDAMAGLDGASQRQIMESVLGRNEKGGVIWVLRDARAAALFGFVIVVESGRVAERGRFGELDREGTALHDMLQAS